MGQFMLSLRGFADQPDITPGESTDGQAQLRGQGMDTVSALCCLPLAERPVSVQRNRAGDRMLEGDISNCQQTLLYSA